MVAKTNIVYNMSKIEKLYSKFMRVPSAKDFAFEDLVTLLQHFGCKLYEQRGGSSHKYFIFITASKKEIRLDISKPHPDSSHKPYQFNAVKKFLKNIGVAK